MKILHYILRKKAALFLRLYNFFIRMAYKVYSPELTICEKNKKQWYEIKGDETLRVNYPLNQDSVVFDVGGFKGDWAMQIYCKYSCNILIFEPIEQFCNQIQDRFSNSPKLQLYKFGLGANNQEVNISVMSESSSTERNEKGGVKADVVKVEIKSFIDFVSLNNINKINLLKINIEGGEYDLLSQIIDTGYILKIDNLQIQFHDFVTDADQRMNAIKSKLSHTHTLTYEYIYVWENWKIKA